MFVFIHMLDLCHITSMFLGSMIISLDEHTKMEDVDSSALSASVSEPGPSTSENENLQSESDNENQVNTSTTIDSSLLESTYSVNLKQQIELKRKLIKVANAQIEKLDNLPEANQNDDVLALQVETIALFETLNKLPYQPPRNDLVGVSLTELHLIQQINELSGFIKEFNNEELNNEIEEIEQMRLDFEEFEKYINQKIQHELTKREELLSHDTHETLNTLQNVKIVDLSNRSKKLIELSKKIIVDYILKHEFEIFYSPEEIESKKTKFLKLLEILLNNTISAGSNAIKYLEVETTDDPLIRYLILNNIVVSDQRTPNRIRLRDFSVDL